MQDHLVFDAAWKSSPMIAKEVIECSREFLHGLARVSPWDVPIDVSGSTAGRRHIAIQNDFSDFEELVLRAMDDPNIRYFSESDPDAIRIKSDSTSVFGMRATFSDYPQRTKKKDAITVEVGMGSSDQSCNSGATIRVPLYAPYVEENGVWGTSEDQDLPSAVFDYLVQFFDPFLCSVYSSEFMSEVTEWGVDLNSPLGWMSFVRSPAAIAALIDDPRIDSHRDGILIRLGEGPQMFKDSEARTFAKQAAIEVRDKLRSADATDWMKGA